MLDVSFKNLLMWGMGEGGGGRLNVNFQTCAVKNLH